MSKISLSGLPLFGNMVSGAGLASVFDDNVTDAGYAMDVTGWAGTDFLTSPRAVDKVVVTAPVSGFDASGAVSDVRISLRAKNGSAPTGPTDGVLLGQAGHFKDVNAAVSHTVYSDDWKTEWQYVWVVLETGVWAALSAVALYGPEVITVPSSACPKWSLWGRVLLEKTVDSAVLLTAGAREVAGFRLLLQICEPVVAVLDVGVDTVHRGDYTGYGDALSTGISAFYRCAQDLSQLQNAPKVQVPRMVRGENLVSRHPVHYGKLHAQGSFQLHPGYCQISVHMNAATDAAGYTTTDGLAALLVEHGAGLNRMRLLLDPAATLIHV